LMSTGSQTNLLWKEGSQRDQSPEWTLRSKSLTETKPGSTFICLQGRYLKYLASSGLSQRDECS
jgi:hypothetical protein